jgi:hypothetical protein
VPSQILEAASEQKKAPVEAKLEIVPEIKVEVKSEILTSEKPISELLKEEKAEPEVKILVKESEDFIIPLESSKPEDEPMFREMKVEKKQVKATEDHLDLLNFFKK